MLGDDAPACNALYSPKVRAAEYSACAAAPLPDLAKPGSKRRAAASGAERSRVDAAAEVMRGRGQLKSIATDGAALAGSRGADSLPSSAVEMLQVRHGT